LPQRWNHKPGIQSTWCRQSAAANHCQEIFSYTNGSASCWQS